MAPQPNFVSRRQFVGRALAGPALLCGPVRSSAQLPAGAVDVRSFGARGDGRNDDTAAIQAALAAASAVLIGEGTFIVNQIRVPSGRSLLTHGHATILRQRPGLPSGTAMLKVVGSNVSIGSLRAIGNIWTDRGEWMHVVEIAATPQTGDLENIQVADIAGQDIRGDVLTIYSSQGRTVSNVRAGRISGSNVYRNVVAVCTGRGVEIAAVEGAGVGYMVFDAEPDGTCAPVSGLRVGSVRGRFAAVVGTDSIRYCEGVHIDVLDLNPSYTTGSSPSYPPGELLVDGLQVRNCRSLRIEQYRARGFHGQAIRQVYDSGDVPRQIISVGRADLSDCCRTERNYLSYIQGAPGVTLLQVDQLNVVIGRPGVAAVKNCYGAQIGPSAAVLGPDAHLLNDTEGGVVGPIDVRGSGTLVVNGRATVIRGGAGSMNFIAAYSRGLRFQNVRLTGGFSGPAGNHVFENSTVNGQMMR